MQSRCSFENWYLYNEYEKHSIVCTSALMIVLLSQDFGLRIKLYFLLQIPPMGKCGKMSSNDTWPNLHWQHCKRRKIPDKNGLPVVRQRKHSWFRIVSKRTCRKLFNFFSSRRHRHSRGLLVTRTVLSRQCVWKGSYDQKWKSPWARRGGEGGVLQTCFMDGNALLNDTKSSHFFPHS